MSGKRILIRIAMMLLLWGALYGMFVLTQNIHPWIRVALGLAICAVYVVVQVKINRKMYGYEDSDKKSGNANGKK